MARNRTKTKAALDAFESFRNLALASLQAPLDNLARWSVVALVLVTLSVVSVVTLAVLAVIRKDLDSLHMISAVASIVASLVGGLVSWELRSARADVEASRELLLDEFRTASARLFGEKQPSVVNYLNEAGALGQFVQMSGRVWNEMSLTAPGNYLFEFVFSRLQGKRLFLWDETRLIYVEIDWENKKVWWIEGNNRTYLYKIVGTE
jgi:hypothetical protein